MGRRPRLGHRAEARLGTGEEQQGKEESHSEKEDTLPPMEDEAPVEDRHTRRAASEAEAAEAATLVARLVKTRDEYFDLLPLEEHHKLRDSLTMARTQKRSGARQRQIRYCAQLLTQVDRAIINDALDRAEAGHAIEVGVHHAAEQWRDRLIEDDAACSEFIDAHWQVDIQRLRQLVRQARRERAQDKPPAASRQIYKLIRPLLEGS